MFSHAFYNYLHVVGIILVAYSYGVAFLRSTGQDKRKWPVMVNGVGLLLLLVSGFGMAARLGIFGAWPAWLHVKLAIWLAAGLVPVLLRRWRVAAPISAILQIALLLGAGYVGIFKPLAW
jgi:hypothetical protein